MSEKSNSTRIPKSMQAIFACLIFGIITVFANVAGLVIVLLMGANSGKGVVDFIKTSFNNHPDLCNGIIAIEVLLLILWPLCFFYFVYKHDRQLIPLIKQMVVGWIVILAFISIITILILLALFHDGRLGAVAAFTMGLLTTPFTMELILCTMGVVLVILLNYIRLSLIGDEYVEMEIQQKEDTKPKTTE